MSLDLLLSFCFTGYGSENIGVARVEMELMSVQIHVIGDWTGGMSSDLVADITEKFRSWGQLHDDHAPDKSSR